MLLLDFEENLLVDLADLRENSNFELDLVEDMTDFEVNNWN